MLDELGRDRAQVGEHLAGAVNHVGLLEGHALVAAELDDALVHGRQVVTWHLREEMMLA